MKWLVAVMFWANNFPVKQTWIPHPAFPEAGVLYTWVDLYVVGKKVWVHYWPVNATSIEADCVFPCGHSHHCPCPRFERTPGPKIWTAYSTESTAKYKRKEWLKRDCTETCFRLICNISFCHQFMAEFDSSVHFLWIELQAVYLAMAIKSPQGLSPSPYRPNPECSREENVTMASYLTEGSMVHGVTTLT